MKVGRKRKARKGRRSRGVAPVKNKVVALSTVGGVGSPVKLKKVIEKEGLSPQIEGKE